MFQFIAQLGCRNKDCSEPILAPVLSNTKLEDLQCPYCGQQNLFSLTGGLMLVIPDNIEEIIRKKEKESDK